MSCVAVMQLVGRVAGAFLLYHLQLAERKLSNQNYLFEWGMIIISDVVETALE